MKAGSRLLGLLPSIVALLAVLAFIEVLGSALNIPEFVLPRPSAVIELLLTSKIPWAPNFMVTLYEAVAGFLLAAVLGMGLAIAMSLSGPLRRVLEPLLVAAQVVPKVAFVPMLFLWLGLSPLPRIVTVLLVCFFPIVIDTSAGLDAAEAEFLDFVRSYNAGRLAVLTKVRLPAAAPNIFAGLKVSVTLAIVGAVVAEFVQSSNGLGYIILSAQSQLNTLVAFAAATLLVLMGFGLYAAILVLEHLLVSWEH
ncbi:MAG: ABC transporter permease [Nitrososphaerota archaeon]|nr:MAG: ABC transporter permease [Nitrososphaerota archaeon]